MMITSKIINLCDILHVPVLQHSDILDRQQV